MQKLRKKSTYEGNPVGLSDKACKEISADLDKHLAALWVMYAQYHKHHWLVEGPQFRDIHLFLQSHYEEVNTQLDAVAERMTLLGYTPTTRLEDYAKLSYVEQESEDVYHIREGFENDMNNEKKIAIEFRKTIKLCIKHGDYGTKAMLEAQLFKIEDRCHHLEHFLGEDSMSVGLLHKPSDLNKEENSKQKKSKK